MALLNRPDNTKELISQETITKNKNVGLHKYYFNLLTESEIEVLNRIHIDDLDIFNYSFDVPFQFKNFIRFVAIFVIITSKK